MHSILYIYFKYNIWVSLSLLALLAICASFANCMCKNYYKIKNKKIKKKPYNQPPVFSTLSDVIIHVVQ